MFALSLPTHPVRALLLWLVSLSSLLSGCAVFNYTGLDAPQPAASIAALNPRPRIAVVLGSGGPRGYAHVGIIKVLEEAGIEPDLIVGTSVGALIGSFWASGMSAAEIGAKAKAGGPLTLFDLSPFADRGWIHGQRLQDYVTGELSTPVLEKLKRPMIVAATRRDDKQPVLFTRGNIGVAVRASSAIPKIISPVGINGVEYEDGDVSLPLAVKAARDAGAQFVIAVDVSAHEGSAPPGTDAEWLARDAKRRALIKPEVALADFLIHPDLGYLASPRREYFDKCTVIGEATARQRLPALKARLSEKLAQK
jgi:NTE family protein